MSKRQEELNNVFNELEKIIKSDIYPNENKDWEVSEGVVENELSFSWEPLNATSIDEITEFMVIKSAKQIFKRRSTK